MFRPAMICLLALGVSGALFGAERPVDPTFLHRFVPDLPAKDADVTTPTCRYKPIFGAGDPVTSIVKGVARYGEMTVDPGGSSRILRYPAEEQIYLILEGTGVLHYGAERVPVRKNDYMYLPPGIERGISNSSDKPCRLMVMGFKIPAGTAATPPARLLLANTDDVRKHEMPGHPPSTLYKELLGGRESKIHRIAAAQVITSLFIMEITPGGTNHPHHHEREEEIYFVLGGRGDMVAGGGATGIEGRYPAKAGDAYFIRLNATVGFYAASDPGAGNAYILAVRSRFPFRGE